MAKRAKNAEPFRPVQASLVQDVLGPASVSEEPVRQERREIEQAPAARLREAPRSRVEFQEAESRASVRERSAPPEPEVRRTVEAERPAPSRSPDPAAPLDPRRKLSREKRYLLTREEEDSIEQLARSLARDLETPVKLSHLVRVALIAMLRVETELQNEARAATGTIQRPANGDMPGLLRFEDQLGRLFDSALRKSQPPSSQRRG